MTNMLSQKKNDEQINNLNVELNAAAEDIQTLKEKLRQKEQLG